MKTVVFLFAVICIVIAFSAYFGVFMRIHFDEILTEPFTVVYKNISGDYRQSGKVMDEIYYFLKERKGIETTKGFGYYFDNPRSVKTENLRSIAGCVLDKNIPYSEIEGSGFKLAVIESRRSYVTAFPYRSKMSVMFSLLKVYPAIAKKLESDGRGTLPVIEIYDVPGKKIRYIIPNDVSAEETVSRY